MVTRALSFGTVAQAYERYRPGGVFASFAMPIQLADPELKEAVRAARSPHLVDAEITTHLARRQ